VSPASLNHKQVFYNQVALPDREMQPVLSGTADTFESIECQLDILLAEEESIFE
jgi:hypothetical protein